MSFNGLSFKIAASIGCILLCVSCTSNDDGGGGGGTAGTTVSGTVTAPNGSLAKLTQPSNKAWYAWLLSPREAWAQMVTGFTPVPNATVLVFRIDQTTGVPIGQVLAQTTTNGVGAYNLTLPAGVAPSSDLILQITNAAVPQSVGTANTMSTPLVQTALNVDPISEGVMREVLAYIAANPPASLANFSNSELVELIAMIRAVVAANPNLVGSTIGQTIANIQAALAPQINQAIPQMASGTRYLIIFSTSLPNGQVGMPYSQPILAIGAPGPLVYQVTGGTLPAGLAINTATGHITGTPTTQGTSNFTVQVSVATPPPSPVTQAFNLTIAPGSTVGTGARLAAGKEHSLAVPANGTLQSWGVVSDHLEIGRRPPPAGNVPGAVPYFTVVSTGRVRAVAAGEWHSVAVTEFGTAHSFGYGLFGQLGTGMIGGAPTEGVQVRFTNGTAVTDAVDVCAGQHHSFLVRNVQVFGQVVRQAWGFGANGEGQLGDGTSLNRFGPSPTTFGAFDPPLLSIACGWNHMLAVMADNTVRAWGSNLWGQLGAINIASASTLPVPVVTDASGTTRLSGVIAVAGGEHHSLALKNDGTVWAWGSNANGKLGDGTETDRARPVQVLTAPGTPLTGIVAIAAGGEFSLALHSNGTVYSWGINEVGQLGSGSTVSGMRNVAAPVITLTGVVAIAAGRNGGADHALALKSDGTVWAWGSNLEGQLGLGSPDVIVSTPTQVPGLNLN